jgi:Secretion system C-terminal sorting domain
MKKITLLLLMLMVSWQISAQTIIIGTGTGTTSGNTSDPIDGYYKSYRYQVVYTAAELSASLTPYDQITALGFSIDEDYDGGPLAGYTIKMGHTSAVNVANHNTDAISIVKNAFGYDPTVTAAGVFDMITFDTPFVWNGIDNIVVDICSDGPNPYGTVYGGVRVTTAVANGSRKFRSDSVTSCGTSTSTTNANRPNIQFNYLEGTPPACFPPFAGLSVVTSSTIVNLSWTSGGAENAEIVVQPLGTGTPAVTDNTGINVTGSAYAASGLTPATSYEFYVRNECTIGSSFSTWSGPYSFTTLCNATNIPYIQDFETAVVPNLPECTSAINNGLGSTWEVANNSNNGFLDKTLKYTYNILNPADTWFFTQGVNLTAGVSYRVSYDYGNNSTTYIEKMSLSYGSIPSIAGMTNALSDHPNIVGGTKQNNKANFTPTTTGVYYFGFHAYSAANQFNLYVDNISVDIAPSCVEPSAGISTVTTTTANLSWTSGNSSDNEIVVQPAGTGVPALTDNTGVNVTGSTYMASGLLPQTTYEFYVRTECTIGSIFSTWSGPYAFTTLCEATNIPYVQDFETAVVPNAPICTSVVNNGLGNVWTVANNPGNGFLNKTLRYGYNTLNPADTWFFTQGVNLTAGVSYRVSYDYGNNSLVLIEKMSISCGNTPTVAGMTNPVFDHVKITGAVKQNNKVNFIPTTTGVYYFGFKAYSDPDQFNLFVDNISINLTPSCIEPSEGSSVVTSSTTASLSWTSGGSTDAEVLVQPAGTGVPPLADNTGINVTGSTYMASGLLPQTAYEFYVRNECIMGTSFSTWSGPYVFNTTQLPGCSTVTYPPDAGIDISVGSNTFSWTVPTTGDPVVSYDLYYGTSAGNTNTFLNSYLTNSATIGLSDYNFTFYWRIVPKNAGGIATGCQEWSFTTQAPPGYCFAAPYGLDPAATFTPTCNGTTVGVIITGGYAGEYSNVNVIAGNSYQFSSVKGGTVNDFVTISADNGLTPAAYGLSPLTWVATSTGVVRFYSHVDNQCTTEQVNRTRSVICSPALSIQSFDTLGFRVYPNPVQDILSLSYTQKISKVLVHNLLGQEVMIKTINATQSQVDMSNLTSGTYLVKVFVDDLVKTIKVVKE